MPLILNLFFLASLLLSSAVSAVEAISFEGIEEFRVDNGVTLYDSKMIALEKAEQKAIEKVIDYLRTKQVEIGVLSSFVDNELKEIILLENNFNFRKIDRNYKFVPCSHHISFCFHVKAKVIIEASPNTKSQWVDEAVDRFKLRNNTAMKNADEYIEVLNDDRRVSITEIKVSQTKSTTAHNETARMNWFNVQTKSHINSVLLTSEPVQQNDTIKVQFTINRIIKEQIEEREKLITYNPLFNKSYVKQYNVVSNLLDAQGIKIAEEKINLHMLLKNKYLIFNNLEFQEQKKLTLKNKSVEYENI